MPPLLFRSQKEDLKVPACTGTEEETLTRVALRAREAALSRGQRCQASCF